jgi:N-acetylglucosamine-6-phosphate deacetylase
MVYVIENGEIYTPLKMPIGTVILIEGTKITFIGSRGVNYPNDAEIIDATNKIVTPGFIDMHVHGCMGFDVIDGRSESLVKMAKFLATHGVTSFLPTTVSTTQKRIINAMENVQEVQNENNFNVLGLYLEGPYLNIEKVGAQNPMYIKDPKLEELMEFLDIVGKTMKVVALAPEKVNALPTIKELKRRGIIVSVAHSNASYQEMLMGIEAGISHVTHVFNAMRGFHHREIGVVGAALLHKELTTELIADCIHVHPSAIRILLKMKGYDKVILVSDAISATGLPDGEYDLGGLEIVVEDGISALRSGILAGSTLTLENAIKNMVEQIKIPISDVIKMVTLNPAKVLNLQNKGEIKPGRDADITIMDRNFKVQSVMIRGEVFPLSS